MHLLGCVSHKAIIVLPTARDISITNRGLGLRCEEGVSCGTLSRRVKRSPSSPKESRNTYIHFIFEFMAVWAARGASLERIFWRGNINHNVNLEWAVRKIDLLSDKAVDGYVCWYGCMFIFCAFVRVEELLLGRVWFLGGGRGTSKKSCFVKIVLFMVRPDFPTKQTARKSHH